MSAIETTDLNDLPEYISGGQASTAPPVTVKKSKVPVFFLISFFLLLIGIGSGVYFAYVPLIKKSEATFTSPVQEDDITAFLNRPPTQTYNWKPTVPTSVENLSEFSAMTAKSALVMNFDTDEVYYAKNIKQQLPMASITKAMVALLTLEHKSLEDKVTVSEHAASVGENSMGLTTGEVYTVHDLLYGLFLHSGNDVAEALAEGVGGTRERFVALMNQRAWEMGMQNTHYTNPSGLEGDGHMYASVEDLAILTKYILTHYPFLLDITKTINYAIPATNEHKAIYLSSEIDLIRTYPGAIGFKTGLTDEAGRCIITIAENGGQRMMGIVLGSQNRRADVTKMLDYAFDLYGIHVQHQPY